MKIVCPQCGAPVPSECLEGNIEMARDYTCDYCGWSGSSTELVAVDGEVKDPRVLDIFRNYLREELGGMFMVAIRPFWKSPGGADEKSAVDDLLRFSSHLFDVFSVGYLQGILDPTSLVNLSRRDVGSEPVPNIVLAERLEGINRMALRALVDLGIVKGEKDPKNIRFLTLLSIHATRQLQTALEEYGEGSAESN